MDDPDTLSMRVTHYGKQVEPYGCFHKNMEMLPLVVGEPLFETSHEELQKEAGVRPSRGHRGFPFKSLYGTWTQRPFKEETKVGVSVAGTNVGNVLCDGTTAIDASAKT